MQGFQVKVEIDNPNAVFNMNGDLTHESQKRMLDAYEKVVSSKMQNILLDFSHVDYINSAGMSVIITILTKAQNAQQALFACGLSQHFQKIFDMVGLLKYMPHYDTKDEAMKNI
ncbi:MAG: anti-sigma factor antagonist [Calditrichaeota bacterium]|nr:MAG: anti-sigma factor antagonist [Calditrichota bacterium]